MSDKCSTKHCRGEVDVIYLGKPLCQSCYEKRCDEEDKEIFGRNPQLFL